MLPDELDVLLVEDDPSEAELILRALKGVDPSCRMGVARDGEEALDFLLARGRFRHRLGAPLPRVILLELKLPKIDGAEVLRALRASPRTSTTPVVMLTSSAESREVAQCYQLGANSCIEKPVEFRAFAETMQALGGYWLRLNQTADSQLFV
ncbi:MAG TPA: response regulator [Gemmatimonadales bacterium]|jgi:CheY-like chemotaxis protein|nr:response regulator [Gemmatimonadales bacterium]